MHAAFFRPGGIYCDLPKSIISDIFIFLKQFRTRVLEIEEMLTFNRIWKQRLVDIGIISAKNAYNFGFSGVMLRGSGVDWDLRKSQPYEIYKNLNFIIAKGANGDCFDRYLIRIFEIEQSLNIIEQCIFELPYGKVKSENTKMVAPSRNNMKYSMESLIHHFKFFTQSFTLPSNETYVGTEAPKGEFGVYLISNSTNKPYRCKIKSPGFANLQALNFMTKNHMIADVVTIIGTKDIVFGEIDR